MKERPCIGCLLGTAVGDALGLPYEGIGPRRAARMFPDVGRYHLLFGKGMVSDDTEHAAFVAQALVRSSGDIEVFRSQLARSLRWWLLGLPAGVGFATLRAIVKLWLGWPPHRSGVFSAGNGPAMRSPLIGVAFGHSPQQLRDWVAASTGITHSDPKAFFGALSVALAAHWAATGTALSGQDFLRELRKLIPDEAAPELLQLVAQAADSAARSQAVGDFAAAIGSRKGISGYVYHTVPCVLQVWFRYGSDFAGGLREIIAAGGDADTTGAILGGIAGAGVGKQGIPADWLANVIEWPRSIGWLERLGSALGASLGHPRRPARPPGYFFPAVLARNFVFLIVVLAHGFRRLAPPY